MNFTVIRTAVEHDLKFDEFAADIFSGLIMRLSLLAEEIEKEVKRDAELIKNRTLFWNAKFIWSRNKEVEPRIDTRVDLVDNRDLEPARIPVFSAGFCDNIKITETTPSDRKLNSVAKEIVNTIKSRHHAL